MAFTNEEKREQRAGRSKEKTKEINARKYKKAKAIWDDLRFRFDIEDGALIRAFAKQERCSIMEAGRILMLYALDGKKEERAKWIEDDRTRLFKKK